MKVRSSRKAGIAIALSAVVALMSACSDVEEPASPATSSAAAPATSAASSGGSTGAATESDDAAGETGSDAASEGAAPGSSAANTGGELTVGVIYLDTQGFYGGVKKGIDDGAAEAGQKVNIVETNIQGDATKEATFMGTLTSQKVDAILTSAASGTASVPAIQAASEAGIPVICYNTCIAEPDLSQYVSAYAFGDPVEFGYQLGVNAGEYFKAAGITEPKIGVLNCEFVEVCVQRREGFEKGIGEQVPGYVIVDNQQGTDPVESISVATAMLTANPDLDAFMGESGGATTGAVQAVIDAGNTGKTVVFGSDMTTDIANALVDNSVLKASVDVSGQAVGRAAIAAAIATLNGEKPAEISVPVPIVLYKSIEEGQGWLEAHADGIP